jgi:hypothetical protein
MSADTPPAAKTTKAQPMNGAEAVVRSLGRDFS